MEEIWKPCILNERYLVSSLGQIKSLNGKINKRKPHASGYIRVMLKGVGFKMLHVLIALTFIPNNSIERNYVNHINKIRSDNRVENLEWVSQSENLKKRRQYSHPSITDPYRYKDISGEIWKPVSINGHSYRASSFGRIELASRIKTYGSLSSDGYRNIILNNTIKRVHHLICKAFHGDQPNEDYVVNHKDYNKNNNCPDNLEWVTKQYNVIHGFLNKPSWSSHNCRSIEQWTINKEILVATYNNISIAASITGTNRSSIMQLLSNSRRKSAGGYYWKYTNTQDPYIGACANSPSPT